MEKNLAVVAIIVTDFQAVERVNSILSEFRDYVVGRMGIPHRDGKNVISVVLEATNETVNSLSGKLGMVKGVKSKVLIAK
jgi:putative iron-only hydrogenase system regulator